MQQTDIEFSIISGSSEEMLVECLDSLQAAMKETPYIWSLTITCSQVDDGLAERLRVLYPYSRIISNGKPRSPAAIHNNILATSRSAYVWLLSSDLKILPGAILNVMRFLERPDNSRVAIASPELLHADGALKPMTFSFPFVRQLLMTASGLPLGGASGSSLSSGRTSSRILSEGGRDFIEADYLRGACVAVRSSAARQVGAIMELGLVEAEEADWHRRFHENGWRVGVLCGTSVIHYGSHFASRDTRYADPERFEAAMHYFKATLHPPTFILLCVFAIVTARLRSAVTAIVGARKSAEIARRYAQLAWRDLQAALWRGKPAAPSIPLQT
ncbi:MAG TPA: hypothetical protein VM939_14470 [Gemmatimonadaceae bacterium]|nr:hypothetical protein [Gemmatimonadaceae bacterium]